MEFDFQSILALVNVLMVCMLGWGIKLLKAQKSMIDSFKSQMDWLSQLQSTVSSLYDPQEIKNIVAIKVAAETNKLNKNLDGLLEAHQNLLRCYLQLMYSAALNPLNEHYAQMRGAVGNNPLTAKYVADMDNFRKTVFPEWESEPALKGYGLLGMVDKTS